MRASGFDQPRSGYEQGHYGAIFNFSGSGGIGMVDYPFNAISGIGHGRTILEFAEPWCRGTRTIVVQMIEIEITEEESLKAQKSERDADELIIKLQNKKRPYKKIR